MELYKRKVHTETRTRTGLIKCMLLLLVQQSLALPISECDYCYPGASCMPQYQDLINLIKSLSGTVVFPTDEIYRNITIMINTRVTRFPYLVLVAATVDDVIKAVKFANTFNMRITIRSSGHDYIGRSTGDGTFQINLSNMTDIKFDLSSHRNPEGVVTAQSGNTWLRVYTEVNKYGRVIVGGSAHTVSLGGYTLGGGHSPVGRKFGLAVDNLLEVEMVTANGSLVYANDHNTTIINTETNYRYTTSNTDIFWAIRGGGGSTFGIVTAFTYKLHYDSKMVMMTCYSPLLDAHGNDVGRPFLKLFNNLLSSSLAPEWGGYEMINSESNPNAYTRGSAVLFINHFGEWGSPSFNTIAPFLPMIYTHCTLKNVSSFLEYELQVHDELYYTVYIFNTFMQHDSFTDQFYQFIYDTALNRTDIPSFGCTGVLIGGNMRSVSNNETAINPNFRSGKMSLSCGIAWSDVTLEDHYVAIAEKLTAELIKFGKGTYFNEPSAYLPEWKTAYWGGNYDRLLRIKQEWNSQNVFICHHCVGSDLKRNSATVNIPPIVG